MKKTFLSLAFVLSISLAFGAESKPVVGERKTATSTQKVETPNDQTTVIKPKDLVCSSGVMCEQSYAACADNSYELAALLTELAILLCGKP